LEAQRQTVASLRQIRAVQADTTRAFWNRPLSEIAKAGIDGYGAFDELSLPVGNQTQKDRVAEFERFVATVKLNEEGTMRFGSFGQVQAFHNVEITQESLRQMFDRLLDLGCFAAGECTVEKIERPRAAQPVIDNDQPVTLDALDSIPDTRDGNRQARELAQQHYLSVEAKEMFFKWLRHLYDDYKGFSPNEEQKKAAIQFFQTWNRSYLNYQSWDECRRFLVSAHIFPSHLLTPDERLSIELEDADLTDRNVRVEFARRSRLINRR